MKILMLADVFFPDTVGGAGRVLFNLSLELTRRGHEICVMTRNPGNALPSREILQPGFHVHRFTVDPPKTLTMPLKELANSLRLARDLAGQVGFDLVCVHQPLAGAGPLLLSRGLMGIPLVYFFHSPWHEEFIIKQSGGAGLFHRAVATSLRWVEGRILSKSSLIMVLSDYMAGKVEKGGGRSEALVLKIPCGVDLERFHLPLDGKVAAKKRAGLPLDRTIFLTIRNLVPRMGLDSLIQAFHRSTLLKDKGLLFIGGKGILEQQLKESIRDLGLGDSVRFLGHVPEEKLPEAYQRADFFVLPTSQLEGFGLVILESMACGTPVLGTPVGAIPEIIGAFDERLLFRGPDWKNMIVKLEEIIEKRDAYSFDPESCRRFVQERYSWAKMAEHFERETARIISHPSP
ncbi:MAG: glycosyltransferase family 4 protein [Deltaproteobacteria bacterium]|nr:glycosyltransferase family 4 protein [Deltaproteobacteria bacterium]MBW2138780.1 glycosyltransferase family 4 protein [Deltaproteobacteria bacterium]